MEEVKPRKLVEIPIEEISTRMYSLDAKVPIVQEKINTRQTSNLLVKNIIDSIMEEKPELTLNGRIKNFPHYIIGNLYHFIHLCYSTIRDAKNLTLSIKYALPTGDTDILLINAVNNSIIAEYTTKSDQILLDSKKIDGKTKNQYTTITSKNTLIVGEDSRSWFSSTSRYFIFNSCDELEMLLAKSKPVTTSGDNFRQLSIKAEELDYRLVPKYINGIKFIDDSEPKLVLKELATLFTVNNTREIDLAKILFQKDDESLYNLIEYDELSECFSGSEEEWFSMSESEKKKFKDEMERASRQLGNRIAKMIGSAECVISAEKYGLRIKSEFLKPKE